MKKLYSLIVDMNNKSIHINEKLIFATANSILLKINYIFNRLTTLNIDLNAVNHGDRFSIALLISWIRNINNLHKELIFNNIPNQILSIASASDLDRLLSIHINTLDRFKY